MSSKLGVMLVLICAFSASALHGQELPPSALARNTKTTPVGKVAQLDSLGDPLPPGILFRLGTTRLRHWVASGLRFTPDGKHLLSIGETDNCLRWDVATGKLLGVLPNSSFPMDISPDSRWAARWDKDAANILEWPSGKLIHSFSVKKLERLSFSGDSKTLIALTADNWVFQWDVTVGKEVSRRQFDLAKRFYWTDSPARFSPDGTVLAGMLKDDPKKLRFWDVASGKEVAPAISFTKGLYDCRWSRDGKTLFAMVLPYGVETWNLATGEKIEPKAAPGVKTVITEIKVGDPKTGQKTEAVQKDGLGAEIAEVTPDGQGLLLGMFGQLAFYDLQTQQTRWHRQVAPRVSGPGLKYSTVISFAFSPVGKTVAIGCSCGHIALLDWTTGKEVEFSKDHPGFFIDPIQFLGDGSTMLVKDGLTERLSVHDVRTGRKLRSLSENDVLAWSPDGKRFAHGVWTGWKDSDPKYLEMKDANPEKKLWKIPAWSYKAWFSADGKVLTYWDLNDRTFHLVDASDGKSLTIFRLPAEEMKGADIEAISADFKRVAVINRARKEIQVWTVTGENLWTWKVHADWSTYWNVRFLPASHHILADSYTVPEAAETSVILEADTGKKLYGFKTARNPFLAASPDGGLVALRGNETTELRTLDSGRLVGEFQQDCARGLSFAFAPNGKRFAFKPDDYTVEVREVATGKLVNKLERPIYFVRHLEFAPDSRTIAIAYNDCTIWMWDSLSEKEKAEK